MQAVSTFNRFQPLQLALAISTFAITVWLVARITINHHQLADLNDRLVELEHSAVRKTSTPVRTERPANPATRLDTHTRHVPRHTDRPTHGALPIVQEEPPRKRNRPFVIYKQAPIVVEMQDDGPDELDLDSILHEEFAQMERENESLD